MPLLRGPEPATSNGLECIVNEILVGLIQLEGITMTQFKPTPHADMNGTSLQAHADGITPATMRAKFGDAHVPSFEEDKGYHDGEWMFTDDDDNVYTVYFRYGRCNIGALPENRLRASELASFLKWT